MQRGSIFLRQFFALTIIFSSLFSTFAQTRRTTTKKTPVSTKRTSLPANQPSGQGGDNQYKPCNGGWSGIVKIQKTLKESNNSGKLKGVTAITTQHITSRDYNYNGKLFVNGSNPRVAQTKADVSLVDVEKKFKRVEAREDCRYDKQPPIDIWKEETDNETTNAFGEGEGNFWLSVNEFNGTYSFNFRMPEAKGVTDSESKTEAKQCVKQEYPPVNKKFPVIVPGAGAEISDQKIDPRNPDVLSGSKTWDTSSSTIKSFSYTVTWSFKRCPAPLELEAVEFDENPLPDWSKWRRVDGETIDGNRVRIRARVTNYASETKFPKLNFRELRADLELPGSETTISIAPGESREIEYIWDTSGWAWEIGAIPASERRVKVELTEPTVPKKEKIGDILIMPRPVILVHGLWADHTAWNGYDQFLKQAHSSSWSSYPVGADPSNGVMRTGEKGKSTPSNSIGQNADALNKQIRFVRKEKNAWQVDIVAHSMGGLISRYYIQNIMDIIPNGKPTVSRLVMLGTPNEGSPCAYLIDFAFWATRQQTRAIQDLLPVNVERFNQQVRNRRGTRFSVLVGTAVPQTCQSQIWGDGVVEIPSARWEIRDFRYVRDIHTALTDRQHFMNFVLKRLGVSHRGDHNPDPNGYGADFNYDFQNSGNALFTNASFNRTDDGDKPALPANLKVDLAKLVSLPPKQSTEIEIPVAANANSGVTFAAPPTVSATLFDEKGAVVGKNLTGSAESKADFRGIPFQAKTGGVWKLKLENTGANEASAVVAAWTDTAASRAGFTIEAGKPNANGQIPLVAELRENNAPLASATVTAQILDESGKTTEISLLDDGLHGDGAANDGIYGALTEKPLNGEHSVTAKAEISGQRFVAATSFTAGTAQKQSTPVKTAVKKSKK